MSRIAAHLNYTNKILNFIRNLFNVVVHYGVEPYSHTYKVYALTDMLMDHLIGGKSGIRTHARITTTNGLANHPL